MNSILAILLLVLVSTVSRAQDEARAAWQVTNWDITVNNLGSERALNARAVVTLYNSGKAAGSSVSLRLNAKAEVKAVNVGAAAATFRPNPEARGGAQRISITLPAGVAPNQTVDVTVDYRLPVEENTGLAAISPLGSQFLPASLWYPQLNTQYAIRGGDTASFRLSIGGAEAISSGVDKSADGSSTYEQQPSSGTPFFVTGSWDRVSGAKDMTAFLLKGAGADERKRADALLSLAANARAFFANLLGPIPDVPVRLVAVTRGGGFDDSGTVLLSASAFRRSKVDSATALAIAEAMARLSFSARGGAHGEGYGVLREGLTRFLATLFLEKEFGAEAAEAERARQRLDYVAIAKRDLPLTRSTQFDDIYFNSVANKGAMIWRLVDHTVGRESFVAALQTALLSAKEDPNKFNLARVRTVLAERGGANMKTLLDQVLDQPTDLDLMVGLPRVEAGQWVSAVRNLGSIEVKVNVVATNESGERLVAAGTIPAHDFGQVNYKSASKIVRVEIDPEKYYSQIDYSNDVVPHPTGSWNDLGEANRLLGAQEFVRAEAFARQMLAFSPRMQEARIVLAKALLGQNKNDEAEREYRRLLDDRLPIPAALAWGDIGLGEIALRRGQAAEASRKFNDAVREDAGYPPTLAARAARIRAEAAANNAPAIDESAKSFVAQLDAAIKNGPKATLDGMFVPGELGRFARGLAGTPSEMWETRVLRTELLDANRLAADVTLNTKQLGVEHAGTTVLILARVGGGWKLAGIEYFEVR